MNFSENTHSDNYSKKRKLLFFAAVAVFIIIQHLIVTEFGKYTFAHIDFESQHYKIPEYFRQLFYSTGDLFPDFAANIGAGQNIYNLSYYGLFNPVILISYLLPFIPMKLYIQISIFILIYAAVLLLYKWLSRHFPQKTAEIASILFLLAAPLVYHTHKHIMFISYLPFVILALIGVDRHFDRGHSPLIAISVCTVCLMSYFFSIGSIAAIALYALYCFIKKNKKISAKLIFKEGIKIAIQIALGVGMAAFLLIPTFIALLGGRGATGAIIELKDILIPDLDYKDFFHSGYSPGLSLFSLFAIIFCAVKGRSIYGKENETESSGRGVRFLSIALILPFFMPVLLYIMNGTMYIDGKVLIPFLPLYILISGYCINTIFKRVSIGFFSIAIFFLISLMIVFANSNRCDIFIYLLIITLLLCLYLKFKKPFIILIPTIAITLNAFFTVQYKEKLYLSSEKADSNSTDRLITQILEKDEELYRISDTVNRLEKANNVISSEHYIASVYSSLSNQNYADFYYDNIGNEIIHRSRGQLSNTDNLLFNLYMGNKYIIGSKADILGYDIMSEDGGNCVYKTEDALPIAYSKNKVMSYEQYCELEYPYNAEALLNYIIVDKAEPVKPESSITELDGLETSIVSQEGISIEKTKNGVKILSKNGGILTLKLEESLENKLLFIQFELKSRNSSYYGDNIIRINGQTNKRPYRGWKYDNRNSVFQYTLSQKHLSTLEIEFGKGEYLLTDLRVYTADYEEFAVSLNKLSPVVFDKDLTSGDTMEGNITVTEAGYLNFSIPYDSGFSLYIDGKKADYEMTDTAFIGCKISEGEHHIRLKYNAPGAKTAQIISCASWICFFIFSFNCVKPLIVKKRKIK